MIDRLEVDLFYFLSSSVLPLSETEGKKKKNILLLRIEATGFMNVEYQNIGTMLSRPDFPNLNFFMQSPRL